MFDLDEEWKERKYNSHLHVHEELKLKLNKERSCLEQRVERGSSACPGGTELRRTRSECQQNTSYPRATNLPREVYKSCYLKSLKTRLDKPPNFFSPPSIILLSTILCFLFSCLYL